MTKPIVSKSQMKRIIAGANKDQGELVEKAKTTEEISWEPEFKWICDCGRNDCPRIKAVKDVLELERRTAKQEERERILEALPKIPKHTGEPELAAYSMGFVHCIDKVKNRIINPSKDE